MTTLFNKLFVIDLQNYSIKLVNKTINILSKLQTQSLKYGFLIIHAILICRTIFVPYKMESLEMQIHWRRS
jgi:hypothetical protein